jgi:glycogen debranching enzyme
MSVKVSIGPPILTINQGSTVMVTDLGGEIALESEQGVFAADTRFVSVFEIRSNGHPWTRLTSSATTYLSAKIYLVNEGFTAQQGEEVPGQALSLVINRVAHDGIHEDLDVTNYSPNPIRFNLEIALHSDFADLFEVKSETYVRRAGITTEWNRADRELRTSYTHQDFYREFRYRVEACASAPNYANGQLVFPIDLQPGGGWHACCGYTFVSHEWTRAPAPGCPLDVNKMQAAELHRQWVIEATSLETGHEDLHRFYRQSVEDMGALRLHDHDMADDVWVPAAGVPWFVTLFGRDSLIAGLQNMIVNPAFSRGCLKKLADFQAKEYDDWRDAEPGKILHELRHGELAHFHRIPHTPYYGTADATPLYLITLHEAWKWTGDPSLLRDYRGVALRALEWIDHYGDLDGDGFQEYRSRSPAGIKNQSWKDSGHAVVYPDGKEVEPPIATCELQGYVFDAKLRMAEVSDALDEPARAAELRRQAAELQQRFEARFWCEDMGTYAFALDADKKPVASVVSNPGHLLWSGIVRPDRAERVVRRLMAPDMWSGWGIRTLSSQHPAYNPFLYQLGAVWPHDNGIIALGFKRYGFAEAAGRVAQAMIEAAGNFVSSRMPELFAGTERQPHTFPVQYRGANIPQAWAAGSIFHLITALLGLRAEAPDGCLYIDPSLPAWLPDLRLRKLTLGTARLDLRCWREGEQTRWDANVLEGHLEVHHAPWRPWRLEESADRRERGYQQHQVGDRDW